MIETTPLERAAEGYARMMKNQARFRVGAGYRSIADPIPPRPLPRCADAAKV
jgi:hypothetical protein